MIDVQNLTDWMKPNGNGCIVSDRITKEGYKAGYLYRSEPLDHYPDSGWRIMAGNEDDDYMEDPDNHHIFAINTICNYDPDILACLSAEPGSAFIRVDEHEFEEDDRTKPIFVQMQERADQFI